MKVESHESRERPSWFRAEMAGNREMLRNKRIIVIALADMIDEVDNNTNLSHQMLMLVC